MNDKLATMIMDESGIESAALAERAEEYRLALGVMRAKMREMREGVVALLGPSARLRVNVSIDDVPLDVFDALGLPNAGLIQVHGGRAERISVQHPEAMSTLTVFSVAFAPSAPFSDDDGFPEQMP